MKALLRAPAGAAGAGCVYLLMCCRLFTATPQRGCCSYRLFPVRCIPAWANSTNLLAFLHFFSI